jgi:hypothetical protein
MLLLLEVRMVLGQVVHGVLLCVELLLLELQLVQVLLVLLRVRVRV